jgi:acyl carrier protein|nr:acyl carrier protein [uncultured Acetatifactor sp.]
MDDTCTKIVGILGGYLENVEWDSIGYDTDLTGYGMDSIVFIQMIVNIEEQFGIEIPDEYLLVEKMNTINKLADVVRRSLDGII